MKIFYFYNDDQGSIDLCTHHHQKSIPIHTPSEAEPNMDDIVQNGRSAVVSSLAMGILATVATSLRFLAKLETKAGLAADDYWITFSLATYWAYTGVTIWGIFEGGGGLDMRNIVGGSSAGLTIYLQVC